MNRIEKTIDLHINGGLVCTQAVLSVYGEQYGIDPEKARLLGRTLAGGVGMQGETCGYVTGALLILAHAQDDEDEARARKNTHSGVAEFIRCFKKQYGTTMCKELLGADISTEEGRSRARDEQLVAKCCSCEGGIGWFTATVLEELLWQKNYSEAERIYVKKGAKQC